MTIRMRCAGTLLLGLAACDATAAPERVVVPADSAAGEVAFELAGQGGAALTVPVHINGRGPYRFVLDTGATLTCLDRALVAELELPERRGMSGMGAGVASSGPMRLVRVDSLRVGGAAAEGLTACELDLSHVEALGIEIDGLLGLDFLREYRVTLDFAREVLLLSGGGS